MRVRHYIRRIMVHHAYDIETPSRPALADATLASVWSRAAVRYGQRTALRFDGDEVTYEELNRKARSFAAILQQNGLQRSDICGVHLERSIDYVISVLAITLTGAAWLPLDPQYPVARLQRMAQDAKIQHLVSMSNAPPFALDPIPRLHDPKSISASTHLTFDRSPTRTTDRAYVIYTSGSSGQPKGIVIEHRSLIGFLDAMQAILPVEALATTFAITSPSFDISLLELFLPLICGGTITLATAAEARDGRLLAARLDAEQPSLLQATPATWRMLLAAGWEGHEQLTLLTGGEAIDTATARELVARAETVWNLYGPTEATVWATASRLTAANVDTGPVPIGYPLAHADFCVLREDKQPVTYGAIGDLYLMGPCLARGYLGQPNLTAKTFVTLPQGRAYRTGDRVSKRTDGQLLFHGRADHQIKLNGFRIEPAEVEAVLANHPAVRETIVDVKAVGEDGSRLVAYIVPEIFDPRQQRQQRLTEHWRTIWSQEYDAARGTQPDPVFNTAGLRSSYDGALLPDADLRDIVEQSCARVRSFAPRRILDLGCGGGLMLFPLAPECEHYTGVDFSPEAIADLRRETKRLGMNNVTLLEQSVDNASNLEAGSFDAVVLNTVIQYFPDTDYLTRVLEIALWALRPGGIIFLGDVRELGALNAFHADIVCAHANERDPVSKLRNELRNLNSRETELIFAPGWFEEFASAQSEVTAVSFAYKEGNFRNEVIDFRYDVVLHKGSRPSLLEPSLIVSNNPNPASLKGLWRALTAAPVESVYIENIRNARRREAFTFLQSLERKADETGGLNVPGKDPGAASNPNDIVEKGRALGYEVAIFPDPKGSPEHFAALLVRKAADTSIWSHRAINLGTANPNSQLSNALQQSLAVPGADHKALVSELQQRAATNLPSAMCPTHYVVLRELPLTPARKIDRHALPLPVSRRPDLHEAFLAPRDAIELRLTAIIGDILGVHPVGACDGFFDLGGDSLATVELLLAVEEAFGVRIELVRFVEAPTAEGLANIINAQRDFRPPTALVTLQSHGANAPLFFIHGAGGLAFTVFELGQALSVDRPVYAIQDPACDPDVAPARTVEAMATALIAQMLTVQPAGPYHICGHSFGGLLAYEMAIQLKIRGQPVAFLGMLDTPTPPKATAGTGIAAWARTWRRELRFLGQILTQAGPMAADGCYILFGAEARFHNRNETACSLLDTVRGFWANVLFRYFHRRAGLASAIDRESRLLMMRQPGIRRSVRLTSIHDTARRQYRPQPYDGTINLIRAETASAETHGFSDETLGWNRLARHVEIQQSPGTHFTMTRGENVPHLATALERVLNSR